MILPKSFYNRNTLQVAQDLLGCFLVKQIEKPTSACGHPCLPDRQASKERIIRAMIVETEAYHGPSDKASHASRGKTERNVVMFDEAGKIYVYLVYGMHSMLNIVTGAKDYPAAVLIRAVDMSCNTKHITQNKVFRTNGPAKLTKALKIDRKFNALAVYTKKHGLWIEGRAQVLKPSEIVKTKRVGIDYAGEYKDKKWRFYIKGNKQVSKKEERTD